MNKLQKEFKHKIENQVENLFHEKSIKYIYDCVYSGIVEDYFNKHGQWYNSLPTTLKDLKWIKKKSEQKTTELLNQFLSLNK